MNAAFLPILAAGVLATAPAAQAPKLEHGPIQIGAPLVLHVSEVAPAAQVLLLASAQPGHVDLGFGILELAPSSLVVAARGTAGPEGDVLFSFPTPLALGSVEAPLHVQAGVLAPSGAPALTQGLHLRLLASRLYVGSAGVGGAPGRLQAYSAVTGALLFEREDPLSMPPSSWVTSGAGEDELPLVVWNHDHGRAAYVPSTDRVVLFDNFSGAELATLAGAGLSPRLHVDPQGKLLYALQSKPARLWQIDFDAGTVLGSLDLSRPVGGLWTAAAAPSMAYVATAGGLDASVGILRVDLDLMVELDHAEIMPQGASIASKVEDLGWSGAELIVTGRSVDTAIGPPEDTTGFLARVRWDETGPLVETSLSSGSTLAMLLVAPQLGWGLSIKHAAYYPWGGFSAFATADVTLTTWLPHYPMSVQIYQAWSFDGHRIWVLSGDDDYAPFTSLWAFDLATSAWFQIPPAWLTSPGCEWGPMDLARVKDPFVDRVFTIGWNGWSWIPECQVLPDRLFVSEIAAGAPSWHVDLPGRPVLLEAVVIP